MPLVSILMPVFNRETLVTEAIHSIQAQTFQDWELIILDDASTDRTLEICKAFEAQDKRIRVFANQQNVGAGVTRNRLTSYATGKYIAHHDSDDISVPERLAQEVELLETRSELGLVCGVTAYLDDEGRVFSYVPDTLYQGRQYPGDKSEMVGLLYFECNVSNPTCMFRRSLLERIPNPYGDLRVHEDWLFLLQVAHQERIWGIPRVLVKTRRGKMHVHLYQYDEPTLREVCHFKRSVYLNYKYDPKSPIKYSLYRKSMAVSLTRQGRHVGGWKGYFNILRAFFYDPGSSYTRSSIYEFSGRALKKAKNLLLSPIKG